MPLRDGRDTVTTVSPQTSDCVCGHPHWRHTDGRGDCQGTVAAEGILASCTCVAYGPCRSSAEEAADESAWQGWKAARPPLAGDIGMYGGFLAGRASMSAEGEQRPVLPPAGSAEVDPEWVQAATQAMFVHERGGAGPPPFDRTNVDGDCLARAWQEQAERVRVGLVAALPLIEKAVEGRLRERLTQEIEGDLYSTNGHGKPYIDGRNDAAAIVRGDRVEEGHGDA